MRILKMAVILIISAIFIFTAWSAAAMELKAGAAKAVITPSDYQGRISVMGGALKGKEHDIYARALSLNDGSKRLVIVTYDLNCLDVATPILRSRLKAELGIDPAYFVPLATHNHAAPIQIVPANFDYGRWLADKSFDLIKEAIANEQGPVKLYFGIGHSDLVRGDPRYPGIYGLTGKPIDDEVQVLKVMAGDKVIAILFNQATHPLHESLTDVAVGHPGYAMEELERRFPAALAMYADACGGDQMIRAALVMYASNSKVQAVGKELAETVLKISEGQMKEVTGVIASKLEVISLPLAAPMSYEDALALVKKDKIPTDIGFVPYPDPDRDTNWVRALIQHYEQKLAFPTRSDDYECTDDAFLVKKLPEPREFPCRYEETITAKIGPMVLVAMQGEVCAPIGKAIKNKFNNDPPLMVFAYMGEHNLYIPTRNLVERNAYQAQVIQIQYASPVGWSPEVEDEMVKGVERMINKLIEQ